MTLRESKHLMCASYKEKPTLYMYVWFCNPIHFDRCTYVAMSCLSLSKGPRLTINYDNLVLISIFSGEIRKFEVLGTRDVISKYRNV